MHTKQSLLAQLKRMDIRPQGTLLVHSSMKQIGDVEGGADTVLDALSEYMKDGLLVLPTHTWSTINADNPRYYVEDTPVCVGILPELFRKRSGVVRSWHPTHSVAALGEDAVSFVTGDERFDTPVARGSAWGKLLDREAQILLAGVDLTRNTIIHGIEEWEDIPGRLTEDHERLITVLPDGTEIQVPSRRHSLSSHHYFGKLEELLESRGAIQRGRFGDSDVWICETVWMTELISRLLELDPDLFSNSEPLKEELITRFRVPNEY
ncbi:AAC(3) family N-acetyltransferase [Paenibacillus marinisediminis]